MKKYYILPSENTSNFVNDVSRSFSLPKITFVLSIYFDYKEDILELSFVDGTCSARYYAKGKKELQILKMSDYFDLPPIVIENKNIKYLLSYLHNIGFNEAVVSAVTRLEYTSETDRMNIQFGTISGDLVSLFDNARFSEIKKTIKKYSGKEITIPEIDNMIYQGKILKSKIFDSLGNLNPIIEDYMDKFGISHSLNIETIQSKIAAKSNDYSLYDKSYEMVIGKHIFSTESSDSGYLIQPISVIIPSFNSEKTIMKVLDSIQSQDLKDFEKSLVEVVIVDDCSATPVSHFVDENKYWFRLNIIRMEANKGRSVARNIGGYASKNEHLVFIDSDVLLAKNFLREHSIRLQTLPKAVFVSLKLNVKEDDELCREDVIVKGLNVPDKYNDKRLFRKLEKGTMNLLPISNDGYYEIISDTSYLTQFGYGRTVNGYDLSSFVITHNMSIPKNLFLKIKGFSESFSGWGLEDTFFGAQAIAEGYFVIPVLSTGVYHIDHPPRSLSEEQKIIEYQKNIEIYKKLINATL